VSLVSNNQAQETAGAPLAPPETFWRVEGSLLHFSAVRLVAFFTWNAQSFAERWVRRGGLAFLAVLFPLLYSLHRVFAARVLYAFLRGVSRDRLDLLGEEYFHYHLKPRLKRAGVEKLKGSQASGHSMVLVSHALEQVVRPLAQYLGIERVVANRLEFRDGRATGRLLEPVIRPRGGLAWVLGRGPDGTVSLEELPRNLGLSGGREVVKQAVHPAERRLPPRKRTLVLFQLDGRPQPLSVRKALAGKNVLLIGVTGFIAKVWLEKILRDVPEIGRVYLLIRPQRGRTAQQRFEKIVETSPAFEALHRRYGDGLQVFLGKRSDVLEGDVTRADLGLDAETRAKLQGSLDLIINSSGLTEFNPDLRHALATNVDATSHLLDFLRGCDHAALMHLSTCYVAGARGGRINEDLPLSYTPLHLPDFDAEHEWRSLHAMVKDTEARAEGPELTDELRRQALKRVPHGKELSEKELTHHVRRYRSRWLRTHLTEAGTRRARELGWPNTYTFSKSLSESLLQQRGADLPIAVVRPSIVESSLAEPFLGWNEGVNTSGPLSYLLGTYFRQLPSNERKCLDLIPVDVVSRGMVLIAAALVGRRHQRLYQLATSANNPCDMRRSIELTSLAHRKHYRALQGMKIWLKSRFDTIAVSKARYQNFSAPSQKRIVQGVNRFTGFFLSKPLLQKREHELARVEKMIELYEPFILQNEHVFEADNVELLSLSLPPEERPAFAYDSDSIDWWDYWINVHVPALRRWCYPLLEGRSVETRPRRAGQPAGKSAGAADNAPVSEASWPSS
jgi:long-chain acyl-CoA synthetase